ncbi:hypothetical protein HKD37_14G040386 [Glycine soja]
MYPLLFSVTTTQVDVPSTCTTKDVPSNVLSQSSLAVSPFKLCEGETKDISGGLGSSSSMDYFASLKMNGSGMEKEKREETPLQGEDESRRS